MAMYKEHETTVWFRTLIECQLTGNITVDTTKVGGDFVVEFWIDGNKGRSEIYRGDFYIEEVYNKHWWVMHCIENALDAGELTFDEIYNYIVEEA